MNAKEMVLMEKVITTNTKVKFETLSPSKYKLKAILDHNGNGRWDSGNYLNRIQPERVQYFEKEIEIRANWDFEEEWDLKGKFK
jgi:hypothetical protein